jgi:hypothetical protein
LTLPCFGDAEWAVETTVTHLLSEQVRIFGVDSLGTDGYDAGLDIPIPPPGVIFYSYFQGTMPFPYLGTDIRDATEDSVVWMLCFTEVTDTVFVSWDPVMLPTQGSLTIDGVDMHSTSTVYFTESGCRDIHFVVVDTTGPPARVEGLEVIDSGGLDLELRWLDVDQDIYGNPCTLDYYLVCRSEHAYFEAEPGDSIAAPVDTTYVDTDVWLLPEGAHYYRVRAVDDAGRIGDASTTAGAFRLELP